MHGRLGRLTAAAAVVLMVGAGAFAGAGSAAAATPIVVGKCGATIAGEPGTPLQLSPSAVLEPVVNVVQTLDPLNLITPNVRKAVTGMGNIPLGAVPSSSTKLSGDQVASAALPKIQAAIKSIPLIGPVLGGVLAGVQKALVSGCDVLVTVANKAAAPIQDSTGKVAKTSQEAARNAGVPDLGGHTGAPGTEPGGGPTPGQGPGTPTSPDSPANGGLPTDYSLLGSLGGWNFGSFGYAPMANYGNLPFATPGLFTPAPGVRYGGQVPGYSPQYGVLGQQPAADDVQTAGRAEALTAVGGNNVGLPLLLAVLLLSGVTAALVRTWVLRRAGDYA